MFAFAICTVYMCICTFASGLRYGACRNDWETWTTVDSCIITCAATKAYSWTYKCIVKYRTNKWLKCNAKGFEEQKPRNFYIVKLRYLGPQVGCKQNSTFGEVCEWMPWELYAPPKTNKAPENTPSQKEFSSSNSQFSGFFFFGGGGG